MIKQLGTFKDVVTPNAKTIKLADLQPGMNDIGNHFIKLSEDKKLEYVIDKVCAHAGGRLILKGTKAICPMHAWELDLDTLKYNDSHICKKKLPYNLDDKGNLTIDDPKQLIYNPFKGAKKGSLQLRWLNHATVYIECNGIRLITDPWLFGPAFMTGWWLAEPSPEDSIELIKKADYIYISHNHPDHLHAETLSVLPKDKKFIVADFSTRSSEKYLASLGYTNILALSFNNIYELATGVQICLFKSGDFRDDSGMYLSANGHEILLSVDANFLNSHNLPKDIDLLMTSFAGGASGFPLCFDNYTQEEKMAILRRNQQSTKFKATQYLFATEPKYYMPYAGMFKEYAQRDTDIRQNNHKNSIEDYQPVCAKLGIELISTRSGQELVFTDGTLQINPVETTYLRQEDYDFYIEKLKEEYSFNVDIIMAYFQASSYRCKQILQILPVSDDFAALIDAVVYADFWLQDFRVISAADLIGEKENYRVMQLKVRPEIFMCVIENKLPWEDFSIGFQMRVTRSPNVYESDFWYYFTNEYIGKENFRYSSFCGACTVVEHNPIWLN